MTAEHLERQLRTVLGALQGEATLTERAAQLSHLEALAQPANLALLLGLIDAARGAPPTAHPMQPIVIDPQGIARFKANKIVTAFYNEGANRGMSMNSIALRNFNDEDRMQFAQLIGYSVSGYGTLSYVSDESADAAQAIVDGMLS